MTKKLKIIILSFIVATAIISTIVLICVLPQKPTLKMTQINLKLGEKCPISTIIDTKGHNISIDNSDIAKIDGTNIQANKCGETNINFEKSGKILKVHIKVYATSINFSKNQVILYKNGENNTDLTLFVDEKPYTDIKFNYYGDIISYNGIIVEAKNIGTTFIDVSILGYNTHLSARCEVVVKEYSFIKTIKTDDIKMNVNQTKLFDVIELSQGEATDLRIDFDKNYVSIENGYITAKKLGTTQVVIQGYVEYNNLQTYTINIIIEDELEIMSVKFFQEDEIVNKLMYGVKFDNTYTTYSMIIEYNKESFNDAIISGLYVNTITKTNNCHIVNFYKTNQDNIVIRYVDSNDDSIKNHLVSIAMQEYINHIEFSILNSNNENIDKLYLFNNVHAEQANDEGYYNSAKVVAEANVEIIADEEVITLHDKTIYAKLSGLGKLTFKALDGSNFQTEYNILVESIKANSIMVDNYQCYVGDKISPEIKVSPIYSLVNFEFTFDKNYIDDNFVAFKNGTTQIVLKDLISNIVTEFSVVIKAKNIDILCDNVKIENLTLNVRETKQLNFVTDQNINIKFKDDSQIESTTSSIVKIRMLGDLCSISGLASGKTTLFVYIGDDLVAKLDIIVN